MAKQKEKHPGLVVQETPEEMWRDMRRPPGWFVIHEADGKLLNPKGFRKKKYATEFAIFLCTLLDFTKDGRDISEEVNQRGLWPAIQQEWIRLREKGQRKR